MVEGRRPPSNTQRVGIIGVLLTLAGLIVAVTVPELRCLLHLDRCSPDTRPTSMAPVPIKIDRVNGQVPRCATFGGEGDVPTEKNLWLAILTTGSKEYFFRPAVVNADQHHWISKDVNVGSQNTVPGTPFTIYAVLVDNATDQQLRQGRFAGGIKVLSTNFEKIDQTEVKRGTDSAGCK